MNTKLLALLTATMPLAAAAQIDYSGGGYSQDFDTLRSDAVYTYYTNLPVGWSVNAISNSYAWTTVTNGYSNNYGVYCFSLESGAADKSIGMVRGSTGPAYVGARFRNASGVMLTAFTLSYFAEQWRKGAVSSNDQTIPFSYSLDATNLTSGTFVSVPALDMHSIHDGDGVAAAMNGNAASNRQFIASTVSGISWLPNQDLWIRWSGVAYSFSTAHALAIDDLSFRAVPELQISSATPTTLRFSWPTNYPGYGIQSAATPTATSWDAVRNATVTTGSDFSAEVEATDTQRFFRLKMQ
jgi:trimeric autotransporter adhesin